ncbi:MAG: C39 family peptidase [Candidatus Thiodiazotropha endolucinida]
MNEVVFLPKKRQSRRESIKAFGGSTEDFDRWIPEVCGIFSLKMIGDTYGVSNELSVLELTQRCTVLGGFTECSDGLIKGVYHKPLLTLARQLSLQGVVEGRLTVAKIIEHVKRNHFVMLSINLQKINAELSGGHLILIHGVNVQGNLFHIHDTSEILAKPGRNVILDKEYLEVVSNKKGLIVWN